MPSSQRGGSNRLFPADPGVRRLAQDLYEAIADAPIISPHGHVPIEWLRDDTAFADAASLFVLHDHYITRMLHADGVPLSALAKDLPMAGRRAAWSELSSRWHLFAGTSSGYWIADSLERSFGITEPLTAENANEYFDKITADLALPRMRPRALLEEFGIEFIATTDDPLDDLVAHHEMRDTYSATRVAPTFRPDKYIDPQLGYFSDRVNRLLASVGESATFAGYLRALEHHRARFIAAGAVSADHGMENPLSVELDAIEAQRLFAACLDGSASAVERATFAGHMVLQMARMSVEDGLVMTVHAGVLRNHHGATYATYGPDTGHDIPVPTSFVRGLQPLLEKYGVEPDFHLVLFTVDETVFSRELAPLAGFYPSVYIGAPWWFLDAPDAMARFRGAVTESAGFYRTSGFVDDTRAFLSIPARHDVARRTDAGFLARMVAEERVRPEQAERIIRDLVGDIPRKVFKL